MLGCSGWLSGVVAGAGFSAGVESVGVLEVGSSPGAEGMVPVCASVLGSEVAVEGVLESVEPVDGAGSDAELSVGADEVLAVSDPSVGCEDVEGATAVSLCPDADSAGVEASALAGAGSVGEAAEVVDGLTWVGGVASEDGSEDSAEGVGWLSAEATEGLDVVSAVESKGALCVLPVLSVVLCVLPVVWSSAISVAFLRVKGRRAEGTMRATPTRRHPMVATQSVESLSGG